MCVPSAERSPPERPKEWPHGGQEIRLHWRCDPPENPSNLTDSRVIDVRALERLKEWGGDKLASQMVRLFLKNSGTRMDQIRAGVQNEDPDEAERGAHSLKSSAANIGAEHLRTLATNVEGAALDQQHERLRELLPQIEAAYAAAMGELQSIEKTMPMEAVDES